MRYMSVESELNSRAVAEAVDVTTRRDAPSCNRVESCSSVLKRDSSRPIGEDSLVDQRDSKRFITVNFACAEPFWEDCCVSEASSSSLTALVMSLNSTPRPIENPSACIAG